IQSFPTRRSYDLFTVKYKNKLYRMCNVKNFSEFMKRPWAYTDLKLPNRLPVRRDDYHILGAAQYLEETLRELLIESITKVGEVRPYFPFKTPLQSSLLYLSLYLKIHNPKLKDEKKRRKFIEQMNEFLYMCDLIQFFKNCNNKEDMEYKKNIILFDNLKTQ